jgi:hypothetical protein
MNIEQFNNQTLNIVGLYLENLSIESKENVGGRRQIVSHGLA